MSASKPRHARRRPAAGPPATGRHAAAAGIATGLLVVAACLPFLVPSLLRPAAGQSGGRPPTPVRVESVERRPVEHRRRVTGDLRALRTAQVATREPGLVLELHVDEGDVVAAGETIAVLDDRRLALEVARIEADRTAAEARVTERAALLDQRERDYALVKDSFEKNAAQPRELLDAESGVLIARALHEQAKLALAVFAAEMEEIEQRRSDMRIVAPFDGTILDVPVEVGEWVGEGEMVVEMADLAHLEAWLNVPELLLDVVLRPGASVVVSAARDTKVVETEEIHPIPVVDRTARTFTLVATIENAGGRLAPGMSVVGWAPTGVRGEHLVLPADAVLRNDAGPYVFCVRKLDPDDPDQAVPTPVTLLFPEGSSVVVEASGLEAGDLVVVEGNERLIPMSPVTPIPRARAASADAGEPAR